MWTLVGAGLKDREGTVRPMVSVMPKNAIWKRSKAVGFEPNENCVVTDAGDRVKKLMSF